MKKKIILLLILTLLITITSCTTEQQEDKTPSANICDIHMDDDANDICDICGYILVEHDYSIDGTYLLEEMTISQVNVEASYYANYMQLEQGKVEWYKTTISGATIDDATYEKEDDKVTINLKGIPYEFSYDGSNKSLTFEGTMNKKKVMLRYIYMENYTKDTTKGEVDFEGQLFGDDINENFYNYCPTILMEGNNTMHIWYCSNEISGNVTDYVAYRKGTLHSDGKWTFSEKVLVLGPGKEGDWDSRHACDPSVVKGKFKYNGTDYNYLMAYLGCYTSDSSCNEVGIAVSQKPEGPWVKINELNPIANYYESTEFGSDGGKFWGYGQPSLVSVDKEGKVLLFYTKGIKLGTYTYCEKWDFSDLNNPIKLAENKISDGGAIEILNNADFAYDPVNKRIYVIKEDHINGGWYPNNGGVNWISGSNSLFYTSMNESDKEIGDTLFKNHSWAKVATIGKEATGFDRVHNSGIVTDEYGWIMDYSNISVVYTMSMLSTDFPDWNKGGQWPSLHTYRLHGFNISL